MDSETVLVTGATGGLGEAFAEIYAGRGCTLVLTARSAERLSALREKLEKTYHVPVHVCPADLSKAGAAEEVFRFVQEQGLSVDVLINNAGFGDAGCFAERPWQKQADMVQVNITALMELTHCFLGPMLAKGSGKILNLSSVAAFSAGPEMSVYYASMAFVRSFSEAVAEEVKGSGVTVTALCPGPTRTGFEKAAGMKEGSVMFRRARSAKEAAAAGVRALDRGDALAYDGAFTKVMSVCARLMPRTVTRKFARRMNRQDL